MEAWVEFWGSIEGLLGPSLFGGPAGGAFGVEGLGSLALGGFRGGLFGGAELGVSALGEFAGGLLGGGEPGGLSLYFGGYGLPMFSKGAFGLDGGFGRLFGVPDDGCVGPSPFGGSGGGLLGGGGFEF